MNVAFVPIAQALRFATAAPPRRLAAICVWSALLKRAHTVPVVKLAILPWESGVRNAVYARIVSI